VIRIETITIEKFRGIRSLILDLNRENFGICGPNGTGKSGVVDAIEFALSGDVSRLSGRGTGDLSVKAHAPHVKERGEPKRAKVTLKAHIPSLAKSVTITRTVENPSSYAVEPDEPDIRDVVEEVQIHPEFALSRREIIRFVSFRVEQARNRRAAALAAWRCRANSQGTYDGGQ
jgi:ABC-type branched-subunit amino acid transport system ATPase component